MHISREKFTNDDNLKSLFGLGKQLLGRFYGIAKCSSSLLSQFIVLPVNANPIRLGAVLPHKINGDKSDNGYTTKTTKSNPTNSTSSMRTKKEQIIIGGFNSFNARVSPNHFYGFYVVTQKKKKKKFFLL